MNATSRSYPWRKWYVADYLADQRVLIVSLVARGLLRDIEALAYCNESPGRLLLNGQPMDAKQVARLRGSDAGEVEKAITELLQAGLLERDKAGTITVPVLVEELREREGIRQRVARHRDAQKHVTPHVTPHVTGQSQSQSQSQKERERGKVAIAPARPTESQLAAYFGEIRVPAGEAAKFLDHYEANGWRVGKNPMKDWQAAARQWKRRMPDLAGKAPTTDREFQRKLAAHDGGANGNQ